MHHWIDLSPTLVAAFLSDSLKLFLKAALIVCIACSSLIGSSFNARQENNLVGSKSFTRRPTRIKTGGLLTDNEGGSTDSNANSVLLCSEGYSSD